MEDLSTAQAILDLSAPHRTDLPHHLVHEEEEGEEEEEEEEGHHHIKTEDMRDNLPVYKLNGGKTTAYTYEAFFASDGRSKKVPGKMSTVVPALVWYWLWY